MSCRKAERCTISCIHASQNGKLSLEESIRSLRLLPPRDGYVSMINTWHDYSTASLILQSLHDDIQRIMSSLRTFQEPSRMAFFYASGRLAAHLGLKCKSIFSMNLAPGDFPFGCAVGIDRRLLIQGYSMKLFCSTTSAVGRVVPSSSATRHPFVANGRLYSSSSATR
jgi:hypothetical protein